MPREGSRSRAAEDKEKKTEAGTAGVEQTLPGLSNTSLNDVLLQLPSSRHEQHAAVYAKTS